MIKINPWGKKQKRRKTVKLVLEDHYNLEIYRQTDEDKKIARKWTYTSSEPEMREKVLLSILWASKDYKRKLWTILLNNSTA